MAGVEVGQVFFSLVFWIGLAVLIAAAVALRHCASAGPIRRDAGPAQVPGTSPTALVHTIRRGRVMLSIWNRGPRDGSAERHQIRVDRRGPDCGDCVECMNQALRWIREREAAA